MTVDILFSGSSGNCTLIRSGNTQILVDCGKSARSVCTSLREAGSDVSLIDAIFITHEHTDHTSALDSICSKRDIPVHMTEPSRERFVSKGGCEENLVVHPVEYTVETGDFRVTSFPLPHDSAAHVGYFIEDASGDTLGIATDMGHVTDSAIENLKKCRRVIIEANHDTEMLACGRYPVFLKRRILSPRGHLSNIDCAELACILAKSGCRAIALAHLSHENNVPSLAFSEVRCALDAEGYGDVALTVADRQFRVRLPECREKVPND